MSNSLQLDLNNTCKNYSFSENKNYKLLRVIFSHLVKKSGHKSELGLTNKQLINTKVESSRKSYVLWVQNKWLKHVFIIT